MIRRAIFSKYMILVVALLVTGSALFWTSQNVQDTEADLRRIKRDMAVERERIEVLKAEWAYLNTPYRLERLAREYLQLESGQAAGVMSYEDVGYSISSRDSEQGYGGSVGGRQRPESIVYVPRPGAKPVVNGKGGRP